MRGFFLQMIFSFLVLSPLAGQQFKWNDEEVKPLPCRDPQLQIRIHQTGYCEDTGRPAVLIECVNCQETNWNFRVEVRTEFGNWQSPLTDGIPQAAYGNVVRTEPLCYLAPGTYFVRVLAWGANCPSPAIREISSALTIADSRLSGAFPNATGGQAAPETPAGALQQMPSSPPQTCRVDGEAFLDGFSISGTLKLDAASPCRELDPYATLAYLRPGTGNRDIGRFSLKAGMEIPFAFQLDSRDLTTAAHLIEVTVYAGTDVSARQIPLASFRIHTSSPQVAAHAGDANCPQIRNLQLVYHPSQPDEPLYLSWSSPNCCQETGCEYAIWTGPSPEMLRLLVKGTKPGSVIREILEDVRPGDKYLQVVVNTPDGDRKAAYIIGQGAVNDMETLSASRSQTALSARRSPIQPQNGYNLQQAGVREENQTGTSAGPGNTARQGSAFSLPAGTPARRENPAIAPTLESELLPPGTSGPEVVTLTEPRIPIANFTPCQYERPTFVSAERQVKQGERITIQYDHSREGHQYTLYFLPDQSDAWVLAPGTKELQNSPVFNLVAKNYHSGKYLILTFKPAKNWGCLSAPFSKAIELEVRD